MQCDTHKNASKELKVSKNKMFYPLNIKTKDKRIMAKITGLPDMFVFEILRS